MLAKCEARVSNGGALSEYSERFGNFVGVLKNIAKNVGVIFAAEISLKILEA